MKSEHEENQFLLSEDENLIRRKLSDCLPSSSSLKASCFRSPLLIFSQLLSSRNEIMLRLTKFLFPLQSVTGS